MSDRLFTVPIAENEIALDRAAFNNWLKGIPTIGAWGDTTPTKEVAQRLAHKRRKWIADAKERDAIGTQLLQVRIAAQRLLRESNLTLHLDLVKQADALRTMTRGVFRRATSLCPKCGGTLRYRKSGACVTCAHRVNPVREARAVALAVGSLHYHGGPCKHCKSTIRYTRNGACVTCSHARMVERAKQQKEARAARRAAA